MVEYIPWLTALGLAMARPLGVLLIFPVFTTHSLGSSLLRNGVLIAISLPIAPITMSSDLIHSHVFIDWSLTIMMELLIGFTIGFFAALPFWAIEMAASLIDTMRGATMASAINPTMASAINPTMGMQSSVFGILFTQVLSVLFLISGGFNSLLQVIYGSYDLFYPGEKILFSGEKLLAFIKMQWRLMFELCFNFALLALLVMLLTDLCLGLINRSAQQLNVFFLAMPIKSVMALFLLMISLPFAFHHYLNQIQSIEKYMIYLVKILKGG